MAQILTDNTTLHHGKIWNFELPDDDETQIS